MGLTREEYEALTEEEREAADKKAEKTYLDAGADYVVERCAGDPGSVRVIRNLENLPCQQIVRKQRKIILAVLSGNLYDKVMTVKEDCKNHERKSKQQNSLL